MYPAGEYSAEVYSGNVRKRLFRVASALVGGAFVSYFIGHELLHQSQLVADSLGVAAMLALDATIEKSPVTVDIELARE